MSTEEVFSLKEQANESTILGGQKQLMFTQPW